MVTSSIDAVLQSSSFVDKMLFHGETNAISVTVVMWKRDYLDVIKTVFGLVEVYGNRFVKLFSMLTRDWLISYLTSHLNLPFCIYCFT